MASLTTPRPLGTRQLTTGALLAGFALVLSLAAYYVPVVGAVLSLVTPLPVAVAHLRYGFRLGMLTTVATTTLAAIIGGPLTAVFVLSNCAIGLALAWGIERRWTPGRTIVLAGAVGLAATALSAGVGFLVIGPESITEAVDALGFQFKVAADALRATLGDEAANEYAAMAATVMENVWLWIGVFSTLGGLLSAYVWYGVCAPIMSRLGFAVPPLRRAAPPARWHIPHPWGLAVMLGYLAVVFLSGRVAEGSTGMLALQFAAAGLVIALRVQGLGLAAHLLGRAQLPTLLVTLLLWVLGLSSFVAPLPSVMLFWAGMADLAFDPRGFSRGTGESAPPSTGQGKPPGEISGNQTGAED